LARLLVLIIGSAAAYSWPGDKLYVASAEPGLALKLPRIETVQAKLLTPAKRATTSSMPHVARMKRSLSDLTSSEFDLLIIGGGITGASLSLDAALRGLSVALVEKQDFGAATSAASSKLLHGGIRYLQHGNFHKVRESAFERAYFQSLAPHLTRYVPFVIPAYKSVRKGRALLKSAMTLYEAVCWGQNRCISDPSKKIPKGRAISKAEVQELIPDLCSDGITGGILFYESHMHSSERMTLSVLDMASRRGAILANYVRVESFLAAEGRIYGIRAKDLLEGGELEARASVVVNATGPWIPQLNKKLGKNQVAKMITGFGKGAHMITRSLTKDHAVALPTSQKHQALMDRGGRHIFIIPWRQHSLIGTTYAPYHGDLDVVCASTTDVLDLLRTINSAFGKELLQPSDVVHAYAGLYPLNEDRIHPDVYQGAWNSQIVDHLRKEGIDGLVSVFGAKYTTARLVAEKALNMIVGKLRKPFKKCQTRYIALAAGEISDLEEYRRQKTMQYAPLVPAHVVRELVMNYGTAIDRVMARVEKSPELGVQVSPKHAVLKAEVIHAIEEEMAYHLDDFVFRRTGLGTLGNPGKAVIALCADLLGDAFDWSNRTKEKEIRDTISRFISG
jgi:glycerol-3-phosphate dehydrogenase